jgi:hypothetical protein
MGRYNLDDEAEATDIELTGDIEKLKPLSDDELVDILPDRADQEELKRLIDAVNAAADKNRKNAVLLERLGTVSAAVKDAALAMIKI